MHFLFLLAQKITSFPKFCHSFLFLSLFLHSSCIVWILLVLITGRVKIANQNLHLLLLVRELRKVSFTFSFGEFNELLLLLHLQFQVLYLQLTERYAVVRVKPFIFFFSSENLKSHRKFLASILRNLHYHLYSSQIHLFYQQLFYYLLCYPILSQEKYDFLMNFQIFLVNEKVITSQMINFLMNISD